MASEIFGVDTRCYRLQLCQENQSDYLTCISIYPPIEIATLSRGSDNKQREGATAWENWEAALASVANAALKYFVIAELTNKQKSRLSKRQIIYRINGKRRFWLNCRKNYAYMWQKGRFDDDIKFWTKMLSEPKAIQEVHDARSLRFNLITADDFSAFRRAIGNPIDFNDNADLEMAHENE